MNSTFRTISQYRALLDNGEITLKHLLGLVEKSALRSKPLNALSFFSISEYVDKSLDDLPRGRLRGIPFVAKDNINTTKFPTTAGTKALLDHYPNVNSPVVDSLLNEGAILVGKSGMHELAFGITSNNHATGSILNPHDVTRIPGGSSGGTGAAVAAGIVPFGLGSDTGGSVRVPSALCGIVGLRPSTGRYSSEGVVPISQSRDTVGPMANSVEDIILIDQVLANKSAEKILPKALEEVRLGIDWNFQMSNLDPDTKRCMEKILDRLCDKGVEIVDISSALAEIWDLNLAWRQTVTDYEMIRNLQSYLKDYAPQISVEKVINNIESPDVKKNYRSVLIGDSVRQKDYEVALSETLPKIRKIYSDATGGLDGIIFPTTPLKAAKIGEDEFVLLNGAKVPTFRTFIRNTNLASCVGAPGISLPASVSGLPIGIEIDGHRGRDEELLSVALSIAHLL